MKSTALKQALRNAKRRRDILGAIITPRHKKLHELAKVAPGANPLTTELDHVLYSMFAVAQQEIFALEHALKSKQTDFKALVDREFMKLTPEEKTLLDHFTEKLKGKKISFNIKPKTKPEKE